MKKPGKNEYRLILPSFFGRRSGGIPVRLAASDALGVVRKCFVIYAEAEKLYFSIVNMRPSPVSVWQGNLFSPKKNP